MPRKGENIYKRKDGRWEGRYIKGRSENGKAVYGYVYAHSYRNVKQKLQASIQSSCSSIDAEAQTKESTKDVRQSNFEHISNMWMDSIKHRVKDSTYVKYRNSLDNYILPVWGKFEIKDITYSDFESYTQNLIISGGCKKKGLSPKTVTDVVAIIRSILQYANNHGYELTYIGAGINVKQCSKPLVILSKADQAILQEYLVDNVSERNLGILLCLFTGLRVGELCALKWDDISVVDKQLYVHSTMQRLQTKEDNGSKTKVVITSPKSTCSIRKIPLPDSMIELINEHFKNCSGFVLSGDNTKFVEPRTIQNHFKRVLKLCNLEDINMHALRHTFATRCIELGFDIKSLSEILGHASVNITMNRYVHPSMELKRENMNKLSGLIIVK